MIVLAGVVLAGCSTRDVAPAPRALVAQHPVVVQGPMDAEVRTLAAALDHVTEGKIEGWLVSSDVHSIQHASDTTNIESPAIAGLAPTETIVLALLVTRQSAIAWTTSVFTSSR